MNEIPRFPDLAGKTALVTGGSGGIGAETARWLARNNVSVTIAGRDRSRLDRVHASLARISPGHAAIKLDCTRADLLDAARAALIERQRGLDILIAFAGGGTSRPAPIEQVTEQDWRSSLDHNVTATFLTLRTFAPDLRKSRGVVVTMASTAGRAPSSAPLGYGVAKAGIILMTRQLAQDMGSDGVRVNCISPSAVLTDRTAERMPPVVRQDIADLHPLRRLGTPADVAAAALFLVSESAGWLTGATLDIAGGRLMH